jgi:glucan phosphorylase
MGTMDGANIEIVEEWVQQNYIKAMFI